LTKKEESMNKLKVGVVGCGYWGPNLIRNFRSLPDCEMKMMCDTSEKRLIHLKSLYPEVEGEMDYEHMLNGVGLDAVAIATPVRLHFALASKALMAGKHVFIEKPMAASVAECEELISIARANSLVLMVGHTFLYSPVIRRIQGIVKSGEIGDVLYISSRRLNLGIFQKDINVAWDLAPHDVSIVLSLFGEMPLSVNCTGTAHITPGIEDVTTLRMLFSRNRSVVIHSSWLDPQKVRDMRIVGNKKMVVYDDMQPLEKIHIYDIRVDRPLYYDTMAEFQSAYHHGDVHIPRIKEEEPLKVECQHFLDCIANGKEPLTDGEQGLQVVRILEAASASLRMDGAAVKLRSQPVESGRLVTAHV